MRSYDKYRFLLTVERSWYEIFSRTQRESIPNSIYSLFSLATYLLTNALLLEKELKGIFFFIPLRQRHTSPA